MGDLAVGICVICGEHKSLIRKYYHYPIKCECHAPSHFTLVEHCKDCLPIEQAVTFIILRNDSEMLPIFKQQDSYIGMGTNERVTRFRISTNTLHRLIGEVTE